MSLQTFNVEQGSEEWEGLRRGIVTASVVGDLITKGSPDALAVDCPTCPRLASESCVSVARKVSTPIKTIHPERAAKAAVLPPVFGVADNETSRTLTRLLVAERITGYTEPVHVSADMERGTLDEPYAREVYAEHYAPVDQVGFMVRTSAAHGFQLGYSPDGLVGDGGLIEIKSRKQKIQLKTILEDEVPPDNMAQIQCGLLVSGRDWCDYVSYCGGMPLYVKRVLPHAGWFEAITEAVKAFEANALGMTEDYLTAVDGWPVTERIDHFPEMEISPWT